MPLGQNLTAFMNQLSVEEDRPFSADDLRSVDQRARVLMRWILILILASVALTFLVWGLEDLLPERISELWPSPKTGLALLFLCAGLFCVAREPQSLRCHIGAGFLLFGAMLLSLGVVSGRASPQTFPLEQAFGMPWRETSLLGPLSVASLLIGLSAVSVMFVKSCNWLRRLSTVLSCVVLLVGLLDFIFFFYDLSGALRARNHLASPIGGLLFCLLAIATLLVPPRLPLLEVLLSPEPGGIWARRLLVASVLAPAFFGWMGAILNASGFVSLQMSFALVAVVSILLLVTLVSKSALQHNKLERARSNIEDRLRAERSTLSTILQNLPAGVVILDREAYRATVGNDQVGSIFRYPFAVFSDLSHYEFKWTGYRSDGGAYGVHEWPLMRTLMAGEIVRNEEIEILRGDGTLGVISVNSEPIRDGNGKIKAAVSVFIDITQKRLAEKEVLKSKEAAEIANSAKSYFLANISHEIRTPLAAIMGFLELMRSPQVSDEERAHYMSVMDRNGQHLMRLIDDILDLSKIEAGKLLVEKVDFSIGELVADLAQSFELKAKQKGISFVARLCTNIPDVIPSDRLRVQQILSNLLSNAIKFTTQGQVSFEVGWESGYLLFRVKDSGIGITDEQLSKLFKPFSQAEASTSRRFGGTGLGLTLSRKLATMLGGELYLEESRPGLGSTFAFKLSVSQDWMIRRARAPALLTGSSPKSEVLPARATLERTEITPPLSAGRTDHGVLQGLRVLLVEDSADNQILVSTFLKRSGAEVFFANDGLEGKRRALSEGFDIVLMDIQMPVMDGLAATRALRAAGYERPIVALTAHAMAEEKIHSLQAGFTEHLTKPIHRERLVRTIARLCGRQLEGPGEAVHPETASTMLAHSSG